MKRPQLQLRDLFWLMIVVALALGWWLEHRTYAPLVPAYKELSRQLTSLTEQLNDHGFEVYVTPTVPMGLTVVERKPVYFAPGSPVKPALWNPPTARINGPAAESP